MESQKINADIIRGWFRDGWQWGQPISHETYQKALRGEREEIFRVF